MQSFRTNEKYPKIYTIEHGGLRIHSFKKRSLPSESHVPFEQIRRDKFQHVERPTLFILTGGVFFIISILIVLASSPEENPNHYTVLTITSILCVLAFVFYFLFQQNLYFVKTFTGTFIRFRIKNNEEEIDQFVKSLLAKRDEYLKNIYGKPNLRISYDAQFSNFHIMHREGILTSEELQSNLNLLNKIFEQTEPKNTFLGYSKN